MSKNVISLLQEIVGKNGIITDTLQQQTHITDWRGRYKNIALAIVFPKTTTEIINIVKLCIEKCVAIVPQGGNTSTCGGSVPCAHANTQQIVMNFSRLREEISIDNDNLSITVSAGYTLAEVQQLALQHDLYFPLSIASEGSAQIGGICATNAGGVHVIKYGTMRDLILGIEAITPDGKLITQLNTLRKNNTNFDLKQLFIGSEGTLGIITKAVLKLYPKPYDYLTILCGVANIQDAIKLLRKLQSQTNICAFEIIDNNTQKIHNTHFTPIPISANWLILCEIELHSTEISHETNNEDFCAQIYNILESCNVDLNQTIIADNHKTRQQLWQYREQIPLAEKMNGRAIKHDIALPISKIPEFLIDCQQILINHYPECALVVFGHLGDGNLHYNVQFPKCNNECISNIEHDINQLVYNTVHKYHGTFSAEHGIGQLKPLWYLLYSDKNSYNLSLQIKRQLDRQNIFNPGKIWGAIV